MTSIQEMHSKSISLLQEAGIPIDSTDELEYYSWPEMFSTTAGPTKGIGGQMFTQFQVHAFFSCYHRTAVLWCAGVFKLANNFEPMMRWHRAKFIKGDSECTPE